MSPLLPRRSHLPGDLHAPDREERARDPVGGREFPTGTWTPGIGGSVISQARARSMGHPSWPDASALREQPGEQVVQAEDARMGRGRRTMSPRKTLHPPGPGKAPAGRPPTRVWSRWRGPPRSAVREFSGATASPSVFTNKSTEADRRGLALVDVPGHLAEDRIKIDVSRPDPRSEPVGHHLCLEYLTLLQVVRRLDRIGLRRTEELDMESGAAIWSVIALIRSMPPLDSAWLSSAARSASCVATPARASTATTLKVWFVGTWCSSTGIAMAEADAATAVAALRRRRRRRNLGDIGLSFRCWVGSVPGIRSGPLRTGRHDEPRRRARCRHAPRRRPPPSAAPRSRRPRRRSAVRRWTRR